MAEIFETASRNLNYPAIGRYLRLTVAVLIASNLSVASCRADDQANLRQRSVLAQENDSGAALPAPTKSRARRSRVPANQQDSESAQTNLQEPHQEREPNAPGNEAQEVMPQAQPAPRVQSQGKGAGGGQAGGRFFGKPLNLSVLGLSDQQKQQIIDMRKNSGPQARKIRQMLRAKRAELRDLMFDPGASSAEIKSKRKDVRNLEDQLEELQLADFLQLRSLLTKEQLLSLPDVKPGNNANNPNSK